MERERKHFAFWAGKYPGVEEDGHKVFANVGLASRMTTFFLYPYFFFFFFFFYRMDERMDARP